MKSCFGLLMEEGTGIFSDFLERKNPFKNITDDPVGSGKQGKRDIELRKVKSVIKLSLSIEIDINALARCLAR